MKKLFEHPNWQNITHIAWSTIDSWLQLSSNDKQIVAEFDVT